MSKLEALKTVMAEVDARVERESRAALAEAFEKLFADHPRLAAVRWAQYTPHFNDGDACEFSIYDAYVRLEGEDADDHEYDWRSSADDGRAEQEAASALVQGAPERAMLAAFGDHAEITATRDGTFDVEGYDHD
jgi:hypothetical protein